MTQALLVYGSAGQQVGLLGVDNIIQATLGLSPGGTVPTLAFATITAASASRLVDFPLLTVPIGTIAFTGNASATVPSVQALWTRVTSPVAITADNITVLKPLGGASREIWVRDLAPNPYWQRQAVWVWNASTGNDENIGDAVSPLLTFAEWQRRVGPLVNLPQTTTITLQGDSPNEYITPSISPASTFNLVIQGTLVQLAGPFVVSAVTAINRAGNQEQVVTANWTNAELGRLAVLADGPNAGASTFLQIDNGGGANAALSSQPWTLLTSVGVTTSPASQPPSVGNTVNTFLPSKLGGWSVQVCGAQRPNAGVIFQNFLVDNAGVAPLNTQIFANGVTVLCQKVKFVVGPRLDGGFIAMISCLFNYVASTIFGNSFGGAGSFFSCGLLNCALTVSRASSVLFSGDTLCSQTAGSTNALAASNGALLRVGDVCFKLPGALSDAVTASGNARVNFEGASYGVAGRRLVSSLGCDLGWSAGIATFPITCAANEGFAFAGIITGFAFDSATGLPIAGARTFTMAHLAATVGAGGFGSAVFDPNTAQRFMRTG